MAEKVIMPQLGLTMKEGKLVHWIKKVGDEVKKDEPIAEIESDKATFELEAPVGGTLIKIVAQEGSIVPITDTIAYIGEPGEELQDNIIKESVEIESSKIEQKNIDKEDTDCDVLVIGGGPGGYVAAIHASQLGAKTKLIEKDKLGGTCLNRGCIPTKALLHTTEIIKKFKNAESYGIKNVEFKVDYAVIQKRKNDVVKQLRNGVQYLLKKNNVEVIKGVASFKDKNTVLVKENDTERTITSEKVIIATGSEAVKINIPGGNNSIITSNEALELEEIPAEIVIVGGGAIGVEFATIFSNMGSKVSLVEMLPQLLPGMDSEIALILENELKQNGIDIYTNAKLTEIKEGKPQNIAVVNQQNKNIEIKTEKILLAVGRKPYLAGLNLGKANVNYDNKGIKVDEQLKTNVDNIYAIGDVIGGILLAHLASAQGIKAVENALGKNSYQNTDIVPACIYTNPEVAGVGLTEEEAKKQGLNYKVSKFPLKSSGKALAIGNNSGLVKILSDKKYGEILGVHIIAPRATDLIAEACLAMRMEGTVEEIATTIHAHPTLAECVAEAAHIACGTPIHAG
ncbi:MAG: dihydrolipoamide dehydrogenase [Clostridia bacterium]|nr:dihydrolipoamide dehydrogenase [Clostridia bacterium]